jgi:hypothetical protein
MAAPTLSGVPGRTRPGQWALGVVRGRVTPGSSGGVAGATFTGVPGRARPGLFGLGRPGAPPASFGPPVSIVGLERSGMPGRMRPGLLVPGRPPGIGALGAGTAPVRGELSAVPVGPASLDVVVVGGQLADIVLAAGSMLWVLADEDGPADLSGATVQRRVYARPSGALLLEDAVVVGALGHVGWQALPEEQGWIGLQFVVRWSTGQRLFPSDGPRWVLVA